MNPTVNISKLQTLCISRNQCIIYTPKEKHQAIKQLKIETLYINIKAHNDNNNNLHNITHEIYI